MHEIFEKIPRTDEFVDNSAFVLKVPYVHTDDFGNEGTFYRKEIVTAEQIAKIEASIEERKRLPDLTEEEAKLALLKTEHAKEVQRFETEQAAKEAEGDIIKAEAEEITK